MVNLKQECSNLVKKHADDIDLICILRKQQDGVKSERISLDSEITNLKLEIQTREKKIDGHQQMYNSVKGELRLLEQEIEQLKCDK